MGQARDKAGGTGKSHVVESGEAGSRAEPLRIRGARYVASMLKTSGLERSDMNETQSEVQ